MLEPFNALAERRSFEIAAGEDARIALVLPDHDFKCWPLG